MRNPLALKVESRVGMVLVFLFSAFLVGFFLIAVKNLGSDTDILNATGTSLKIVSPEERLLIDQWLKQENIGLSVKEVGYRYIIQKFPDKPWLAK